MPGWDENSPELKANIKQALKMARNSAKAKDMPTLGLPRQWQRQIMEGLSLPSEAKRSWIGMFRGESGQEDIGVAVGGHEGTHPLDVKKELEAFISKIKTGIEKLDAGLLNEDGTTKSLSNSDINFVISLMALAHGEWVRIHPFANGNGRTARLWANWIAMRYGLPPFIRLRPRPQGGYGWASSESMGHRWQPMVMVFKNMLEEFASSVRVEGDPE